MMPQFKSQQVTFHIVSTEVRSADTKWNMYLKRKGKKRYHAQGKLLKLNEEIHTVINQTKSINYSMFDYEIHYPMIFKL